MGTVSQRVMPKDGRYGVLGAAWEAGVYARSKVTSKLGMRSTVVCRNWLASTAVHRVH